MLQREYVIKENWMRQFEKQTFTFFFCFHFQSTNLVQVTFLTQIPFHSKIIQYMTTIVYGCPFKILYSMRRIQITIQNLNSTLVYPSIFLYLLRHGHVTYFWLLKVKIIPTDHYRVLLTCFLLSHMLFQENFQKITCEISHRLKRVMKIVKSYTG